MYNRYDNIFFNILIKYQLTNSKYILLHFVTTNWHIIPHSAIAFLSRAGHCLTTDAIILSEIIIMEVVS